MTQMESEQQPMTHARLTADAPAIDSSRIAEVSVGTRRDEIERREAVFHVANLDVAYSGKVALKGVGVDIYENTVTAFIGPSGCGKSTFIRCFNRMNDLIVGATVTGTVDYHGKNLYARDVDPVEVRRRIGMVFQKPNPFPKSIYDNVAFNPTPLGQFTAMPVQIYQWVGLPDPAFKSLAAAAILVLLGIVLTMNALAIFLRSRFRQNW